MKSNKLKNTSQKPVRLWPGIIAVISLLFIRFILPMIAPETIETGVMGGLVGGILVFIWWAFFSRMHWIERWGAIVLIILSLYITSQFIHISIETAMQGYMFIIYSIPILCLALVIWAIIFSHSQKKIRIISLVITILLSSGLWTMVRTDGMSGEVHHSFNFRWSETAEERLLAETVGEQISNKADQIESNITWSGFRGNKRDGIVHNSTIETDWLASPPSEIWRQKIGPGCSSFAVSGDYFYTQEQRGEEEVVSCYKLTNGKMIWKHSDKARFWDSHAGAGPRSTPTLNDSCVYTLGATGILNALDARDGRLIWSRNAADDTKEVIPGWGYTSSPLVVDDKVFVAIASKLVAYDRISGKPLWYGNDSGESYSSPHLFTIDGVPQIILMSLYGLASYEPDNGNLLWEIPWKECRIVQPAIAENGDLILSAGQGKGIRRYTIKQDSGSWKVEEKWSSRSLRPNFYDFVIHKDHAYGFDGQSVTCIELKNGKRKWKKGRYGGQLILLAEQDLLLVLSEKGNLALIEARPEQFTELAQFPAIKGKTWNHPTLVNDVLLVRNTQEMAAFKLEAVKNSQK